MTRAVSASRRPEHQAEHEKDNEHPDDEDQCSDVPRLCSLHNASPKAGCSRIPGRLAAG
jgi:hypothetical protein